MSINTSIMTVVGLTLLGGFAAATDRVESDNPSGAFVDWNTRVTCEGQ